MDLPFYARSYLEYVDAQGYGAPEALDTTPLKGPAYNGITAEDGANFSLTLTLEQQALIQNMSLYLIRQDDEGKKVKLNRLMGSAFCLRTQGWKPTQGSPASQ